MSKWWKEIDWRCIQMNFREIDMLDVKVDKIIASLKEFDATVFMINTGGIIASYDSKLPFQHQSEFLKSDSLKEIIDACHKENIRVISRMDFSKIREDIFKDHPEWAFRTPTNDVINYNGNISTCMNGGYQQEAIFDILGEIIDTLHVDGFYFNMTGMRVFDYDLNFYGLCHCDSCKTKFRDRFGMEIPEFKGIDFPIKITDPKIYLAGRTPEMYKYAQFQTEEETKLVQKLRSYIRDKDENCAIMDVDFKRSESNSEVERPLPRLPYKSSMKTRMNLGTNQQMISSNTTVDFIGFSFRHVSVSPALQSLRLWQSLANFGGLDYYLIGRLDNHQDKSAFEAIKTVFNFRAKHENIYKDLVNQATVLLIHNSHPHKPSREEQGWVLSLTENHIAFAEVHESLINTSDLQKYSVIISSGSANKQLALKLEDYVASGGTLLLTGQLANTSVMDRLVGVSTRDTYDKHMHSCMFVIHPEDRSSFPSMDKTDVIFFGTTYDKHQYKPDVEQYLQLSLPQRFGPPEMVYGEGLDMYPGVTKNSYNKGTVYYIPAEVGAAYFREGWENTSLFMSDVLITLIGLTNLAPSLSKTAEVTHGYNKSKNYDVVQIVNANGFFGVQVFEPTLLYDIEINIPLKGDIKTITQVSTDTELSYTLHKQYATVHINRIHAYEALVIQY